MVRTFQKRKFDCQANAFGVALVAAFDTRASLEMEADLDNGGL